MSTGSNLHRGCLSKQRFNAYSTTAKAIKRVFARTGRRVYPYHCLSCDGFHLTKQRPASMGPDPETNEEITEALTGNGWHFLRFLHQQSNTHHAIALSPDGAWLRATGVSTHTALDALLRIVGEELTTYDTD